MTLWVVDPTVVLEELVMNTGGEQPSHLGPPESLRIGPGGVPVGR